MTKPTPKPRKWLRVVLIVVISLVSLFVAVTIAAVALWVSLTA